MQGNGAKARRVLDAWAEVWLSPREPTRSGGATAVYGRGSWRPPFLFRRCWDFRPGRYPVGLTGLAPRSPGFSPLAGLATVW